MILSSVLSKLTVLVSFKLICCDELLKKQNQKNHIVAGIMYKHGTKRE